MDLNFHEDLRRAERIRASSDRSFGLVWAAALTIVGLWPLRAGGAVRLPLLAPAAALVAAALLRPAWLHPLNWVWARLGWLLGRVVNPVLTAVLFFLVFAPAGLIARLRGADPLRLKPTPDADSYWIIRHPPGPPAESMSKQF